MRKALIATSIGAATLALAGLDPVGAVPTGTGPVGATAPELARGAAHGEFSFPMQAGRNVSVMTATVEPGQVVDWGDGSDLVIVKSGTLTNYPSCAAKESWASGGAYFRTSVPGGATVAGNEGDGPVELLVISSDATGEAPAHDHGSSPAGGCPTGDAAELVSMGSGPAYTAGELTQAAGELVVVSLFTLQPGYTSSWHRHPGANVAVQTKGSVDNWTSCKDKEVWDPGNTYFHAPGHHGKHPNLTNNKGDQPAEIVAVLMNVPGDHPEGVTPLTPQPPPAECPTSSLTY